MWNSLWAFTADSGKGVAQVEIENAQIENMNGGTCEIENFWMLPLAFIFFGK